MWHDSARNQLWCTALSSGSADIADNLMLVNKAIVKTWENALANEAYADVELQAISSLSMWGVVNWSRPNRPDRAKAEAVPLLRKDGDQNISKRFSRLSNSRIVNQRQLHLHEALDGTSVRAHGVVLCSASTVLKAGLRWPGRLLTRKIDRLDRLGHLFIKLSELTMYTHI